jgi:L-fuculose-phosphate aldolase
MKKEEMIRYYRDVLSEYSRRSFARGLVGGTGGNLSLRIPDTDAVLITPTGVSLEEITPDVGVLVDLEGNIIESPLGYKGSKETTFHLSAYKIRPDVLAVAHLHPPYSTAYACRGEPLPLTTVSSRLILKDVPCIPCYNPGSRELADCVTDALKEKSGIKALLMQDHGILALGPDMKAAYYTADLVEHTAQVAFFYKQI